MNGLHRSAAPAIAPVRPQREGGASAATARPLRRRSRAARVAPAALGALAALLLGLRLVGEQRFAVAPETVPDAPAVADASPLVGAVRRMLAPVPGASGADGATVADATRPGSAFVPLGDARAALLTRLALIGHAADRLDVQYYLLEDDEVGNASLEALLEAARRGVRVRLLLDDIGLVGRAGALARLDADEPNLEVRVFNPTLLRAWRPLEYVARFPRATRRMHNKALVADGVAAVVGGRNLGNDYFDVATDSLFEDIDLLAVGEAARDVAREFDRYWHGGVAVDVDRVADPADDREALDAWRERRAAASSVHREALGARDEVAALRLLDGALDAYAGRAAVLADAPTKVVGPLADGDEGVAARVLAEFAAAREELLICSPYLIPGEAGMAVFRELRARGVEITVLTNSFSANDVAAVHAGYRDWRRDLLEIGVALHEFRPGEGAGPGRAFLGASRTTLHAKAFVVDGERAFVGSFNLDPRSAVHNTEMGLLIDAPALAVRLRERLSRTLEARAWRLALDADGELAWHGLDASGAGVVHREEPGMSRTEEALVYLASWLPIEWLL